MSERLSTAMDESLATQSESLEAKLRQVEADVRGAMREADSRAREMNGQLEQAMTSGLDAVNQEMRQAVTREELSATCLKLETSTSEVLSSVAEKLARVEDAGRYTSERIDELSAQRV